MEASAVPRAAPTGVAAFASPSLLRLLSDDRLVALVRDGNTNAFEALYDRHHRAILSFCRHMLGEADEAEDAVQHTFIAAYNDLVTSRKAINLRAWLFAIARNRCVTMLRARRDRTAVELGEPATDGLAAEVQRRQDLRDLVLDINHLPTDQRAALVLAEIGALSHDEIGSVIGVPRGKVKALVFQARESLLASRDARETDCHEIREQLATVRGGALRRTTLRRHLRQCEGCREFRGQVERQRQRIAVILPVLPTIALREAILGAAAGGGVAAAGGVAAGGGGLLGTGSLLKGIAGKSLIAALVAALGTGTILVVHGSGLHGLARSSGHLRGRAAPGNLSRGASQLASRSASAQFSTGSSPETAPAAVVVALPSTGFSRAGAPTRAISGHLGAAGGASPPTGIAPGSGATVTAPSTLASGTPVAVAPVLPDPVTNPSPQKGAGHGSGDAPPGSSSGSGSGTGSPLGGMPGAGDQGSAGGQGSSGGGSTIGLSGKGGNGSSSGSSSSGDGSGGSGSGGGAGGSEPGSSTLASGGSAAGDAGSSADLGAGAATGESAGPTASGVTGSGVTASGLIASGPSAVGRSDARHASSSAGERSSLERGSRAARHRPRRRARLDGRILRFR